MTVPNVAAAASSTDVRDQLHDLLARDLVGPWDGPNEAIVGNPRGRYLAGALAPIKIDPAAQPSAADSVPTQASSTADDMRAGDQALIQESTSTDDGVPGAEDSAVADATGGDDDEDKEPASRIISPSSMGLRFRVPSAGGGIRFAARWGSYAPRRETDDKGYTKTYYDRIPHEVTVDIAGDHLVHGAVIDRSVVEDHGVAEIKLTVEPFLSPDGKSLILEAALQNVRVTDGTLPPRLWMFQAELEAFAVDGTNLFLPIRDALDGLPGGLDPEEERLELLYRDRLEFAVGRTCSATWSTVEPAANHGEWVRDLSDGSRTANRVKTTWLPTSDIPQTIASGVEGTMLGMSDLATSSQQAIAAGLAPLVAGYRAWIKDREGDAAVLPPHLKAIANETIADAVLVANRLDEGIALLASDADAFKAFQFMNKVMAEQRVHSEIVRLRSENASLDIAGAEALVDAKGTEAASWRHFQIGFILMQLAALSDPTSPRRSGDAARAELLFFPTGGGKTEAYLGLAAFTFGIRRLQGIVDSPEGSLNGGDGVGVLMRYTLRLLTTQQFQRATALVCAAELERLTDPDTWGSEPFRIGLWVGSNVSPRTYGDAKKQIIDARATPGRAYGVTVLQIQRCPWCGTKISAKKDIQLDDVSQRVLVKCGATLGSDCPFADGGSATDGLPILTVDEEIYRFPPSFLLATVDKFSRLAREGQAASLFGYVAEKCPRHGYRHPDTPKTVCGGTSHNAKGSLPGVKVLPVGRLRPPDLVIQDELHLITGALGTAVGLFEIAVDTLCSWRSGTDPDTALSVLPLVVASTATSRNAENQVRALYGRSVDIFPPQVLDITDTYFSIEVPVSAKDPGRRYVGICAHGAKLTLAEIRVSEILLLAGQKLLDENGDAAEPYATMVGYFSATRELAGMRRYLDDDVTTRITNPDRESGYPRRGTWGLEIGELTSRVSSQDIGATLERLAVPFSVAHDTTEARRDNAILAKALAARGKKLPSRDGDRPYDVVLATSMLQVGVDVGRLGLMLVVGQPKNTAEYIQASSRVGRIASKPGLVVTLANRSRPRDMAHYEQFEQYHRAFYAHVEALSVTPYSDSALERGLSAVLVSIARVLDVGSAQSYSPDEGAINATTRFAVLTALVDVIVARAVAAGAATQAPEIRAKLERRLEAWYSKAKAKPALAYSRSTTSPQLLKSPEDGSPLAKDAYFRIANSMREVQPEISLIVRSFGDQVAEADPGDAPAWTFPTGGAA